MAEVRIFQLVAQVVGALDRLGRRLAGEEQALQLALGGAAERQSAAVEQRQPVGGGVDGQRRRKQPAAERAEREEALSQQ